ncbi:Poly(A) RNA polymerase [Arachis hypogaea]|nr:Poly(A) RNA polymerase [Arachis hypogaea]
MFSSFFTTATTTTNPSSLSLLPFSELVAAAIIRQLCQLLLLSLSLAFLLCFAFLSLSLLLLRILNPEKRLHHHQQQQNHLQIPYPHNLSYLQNLFELTHNPFAPPPDAPQTLTPIPNSNIGIDDLKRLGFSVETAATTTTTTNISNNSNTIVDAFVMQQELKLKFGSLPKEVED